MENEKIFAAYSKMSEDTLYSEIGLSIRKEFGYTKPDPKKLIDDGRNWFKNNLIEIQELVCKSDSITNFRNSHESTEFFFAVCDVVSHKYIDFAPFAITSVILKISLNKFCQNSH